MSVLLRRYRQPHLGGAAAGAFGAPQQPSFSAGAQQDSRSDGAQQGAAPLGGAAASALFSGVADDGVDVFMASSLAPAWAPALSIMKTSFDAARTQEIGRGSASDRHGR
jgi:hypothetical protein